MPAKLTVEIILTIHQEYSTLLKVKIKHGFVIGTSIAGGIPSCNLGLRGNFHDTPSI